MTEAPRHSELENEEEEELASADDVIIGRALKRSLLVLIVLLTGAALFDCDGDDDPDRWSTDVRGVGTSSFFYRGVFSRY